MARVDHGLRASLVQAGELFGSYHPKMRALHESNADELHRIMQKIGWPTVAQVGEEAASAAWLIAQHAISRPAVMRAARDAIKQSGEASAELAQLEDRIAVLEGRPQTYGTQFDWDETGRLSPKPIQDEACVEDRRSDRPRTAR